MKQTKGNSMVIRKPSPGEPVMRSDDGGETWSTDTVSQHIGGLDIITGYGERGVRCDYVHHKHASTHMRIWRWPDEQPTLSPVVKMRKAEADAQAKASEEPAPPPEPPEDLCGSCRFYVPTPFDSTGELRSAPHKARGECRLLPPVPVVLNGKLTSVFADVPAGLWCGQHEPRED